MKKPSWAERRRRDRQTLEARAVIDRVLTAYGIERDVREHRLVIEWNKVVGPKIAQRCWPSGLKDGVLSVRAASSAWLQELSFLRNQIIARANQLVGDPPLVRKVAFHLGRRRGYQDDVVSVLAEARRKQPRRRVVPHRPPPSPDTMRVIQEDANSVADPELRDIILAARTKFGL